MKGASNRKQQACRSLDVHQVSLGRTLREMTAGYELWLLEDFYHLKKTNEERFWLILLNFFKCTYIGKVLLFSMLSSF